MPIRVVRLSTRNPVAVAAALVLVLVLVAALVMVGLTLAVGVAAVAVAAVLVRRGLGRPPRSRPATLEPGREVFSRAQEERADRLPPGAG